MGNWDHISGQKSLIDYFTRAIGRKQISHAYILEGEPGTPKHELAEAFARMLQCETQTGCKTCHSCRAIESGNHPDVIWVRHEKPELIRIDEIRKQLVEDMGIRPYSSPYKIYIVEEAEKMNVAAQNALLKTLEEPPYYGIILLLTVNSSAFLPTILSRSIILKLQNMGEGQELLEEDARTSILSVLKQAADFDRTDMALAAASWKNQEISPALIFNLVRIWIRDVLIWKEMPEANRLVLNQEIRGIKEAAEKYSYAQLNRILLMADRTEARIASNVNMELAVELFLAEMKVERKAEVEDDWADAPFPDMEEARFYMEQDDSYMEMQLP